MKLGDGRKMKMHKSPPCDERDRLRTECPRLLGEWLRYVAEVKQTSRSDPKHALRVKEAKEAKRRLDAANAHLTQHTLKEHGCW
jgi:hypothetical protein